MHPLVAARQALANIVLGKVDAGLRRSCPDGRLRDSLAYYGAHTGRWSGKGMQLHNLTRTPEFEHAEKEIAQMIDRVRAGRFPAKQMARMFPKLKPEHHANVLFAIMLRASIRPDRGKLAVLDYSLIEARANSWAAGDSKALARFRAYDEGKGPDPYCSMASKIFGREITKADKEQRQIGKAAVLGCGYQMGAPKFNANALKAGIDLSAQGVDAVDVVASWRELNSLIVKMWYELERGFQRAAQGRTYRVGPFTFRPNGADVEVVLPSGRSVVYSEAKAKRGRKELPNGMVIRDAWNMTYLGQKNFREHVYGGKLCENLIQALCRDLLADALVRAEAAGLEPIFHVHDEAVCQVESNDGFEELRQIMLHPPDWADGLPMNSSGFCEERYRK